MQDIAAKVAISELLQPTLGVTEQVLAVHQLSDCHGNFSILLIDEESEPGAYYIYFEIKNQPYHYVVVVRFEKKKLIASTAYIEAAARVYLLVCSSTLSLEAIGERIGLKATEAHAKCTSRYPKNPRLKFTKNRWYFEPQKDLPGSLENKLQYLLNRLEPVQANIASLETECQIHLNICYEGYKGWMGGWHLDRKTLRQIKALNAEIDFDLYAYGDFDLP